MYTYTHVQRGGGVCVHVRVATMHKYANLKRINMQNELAKTLAVAFTIIAIATESALIISGLIYGRPERVIVAMFGLIAVVPMIVSMWDDVRKENA